MCPFNLYRDEDCDTFTISANCTGNEDNFTQCHLDTATDCPDIAYLVCGENTTNYLPVFCFNAMIVQIKGRKMHLVSQ